MTSVQEKTARRIAVAIRRIELATEIVDGQRPRVEVLHPHTKRAGKPWRVGVVELEPEPRIAEAEDLYRRGIAAALSGATGAGGIR